MTARFIVLEGCDGSGTTTHAAMLRQHLEGCGIAAVTTAEPSQSAIGVLIRKSLTNGFFSADAYAALFAADRYVHIEQEISPAIESGKWVICDRYVYSSIVYQAALMDIPTKAVLHMNYGILQPDAILHLRVSANVAWSRVRARTNKNLDLFESQPQLEKIVKLYDSLPDVCKFFSDSFKFLKTPIDVINSEGTPEEVSKDIIKVLHQRFSEVKLTM